MQFHDIEIAECEKTLNPKWKMPNSFDATIDAGPCFGCNSWKDALARSKKQGTLPRLIPPTQ
jgi:hypothetical protein